MASILRDLDVEFVSLVDRAAVRDPANTDEPMRFPIWKRDSSPTPSPKGESMTEQEMRAAVEKAEQERDTAKTELEKAEQARADLVARVETLEKDGAKLAEPVAQIDKSELAPEVRALIEKAEAAEAAAAERIEKAEKNAAEAAELAKAERDQRVTREYVAKAAEYAALSVDAAVFGPVLKSVSEQLTADQAAELDRVLKAADEQIRKGSLFAEQGRSGDGRRDTGALADAVRKAEELRETNAALTSTQALDHVLSSDRALQERYLAEQRGL